jgi:hypothetical protein
MIWPVILSNQMSFEVSGGNKEADKSRTHGGAGAGGGRIWWIGVVFVLFWAFWWFPWLWKGFP